MFQEKSVVVSSQSIEDASAWINEWTIDFKSNVISFGDTITAEATLLAFKDDCVSKQKSNY